MSFFRKHVRGLLRQTFSNNKSSGSSDDDPDDEYANGRVELTDSAIIYERILNGRNGRKTETPEIYSGKTGLDLPVINLAPFGTAVRSAVSGPDGGLTNVQQMRQQPIVRMANLDDELSLSMGSEDEFEEKEGRRHRLNGSLESLGFTNGDLAPSSATDRIDWNDADGERAFGMSVSLYETHPITGQKAGMPIADVFGVLARENNAILALADGVNWGEGARLAARCAIRGAVDHLNAAIESGTLRNTTEVFHTLLGAFHTAHALILQEGGALTTLCVGLIAPVRHSDSFVLCVCNVGDSLCFVQNEAYGVREVTLASHQIEQHRNMRDAGGALGPVDGRNPQLHNLTCSMTFVEEGDLVFITSDGVSDNFDPVVGKFCVIKKEESEKENTELPPIPSKPLHKTKSAPNGGRCVAILPSVEAADRQELMLLRMADVILNGIGNLNDCSTVEENSPTEPPTPPAENLFRLNGIAKIPTTASALCHHLVSFAYNLSNAKRRTLEDPELYRTRTHSRTEERLRRKMIRNMIMEMPGKLDHASVVAFRVGRWDQRIRRSKPIAANLSTDTLRQNGNPQIVSPTKVFETAAALNTEMNCSVRLNKPIQNASCSTVLRENDHTALRLNICLDIPPELIAEKPQLSPRPSPYEEQPTAPTAERKNRKHKRGSIGRHTLGVDVTWLKKLVINRHLNPTDSPKAANHGGSRDAVDEISSPLDSPPDGPVADSTDCLSKTSASFLIAERRHYEWDSAIAANGFLIVGFEFLSSKAPAYDSLSAPNHGSTIRSPE